MTTGFFGGEDMGCSKTTQVLLLTAVLFFSVAAGVCAGEAPAQDGKKNLFSASDSSYKSPFGTETDDGLGGAFRRMMLAVLIVVLLGVAAMVASKKLLPKIAHTQGKKIKVLETIHLGTRKAVHLLEIGNQQILIGSTHDRITKLADIFSETGFPLTESGPGEVTE